MHSGAGDGLLQKTGTGGRRYLAEIFLWLDGGEDLFFVRLLRRKPEVC